MMMLAASVFLQTDFSRGFLGQSIAFRPSQSQPPYRILGLNPLIGLTSDWEGSVGTPDFSNAAEHKEEPTATRSRSGGQT